MGSDTIMLFDFSAERLAFGVLGEAFNSGRHSWQQESVHAGQEASKLHSLVFGNWGF